MRQIYLLSFLLCIVLSSTAGVGAEELKPILPGMSAAEMEAASLGCKDCHIKTDAPTMHTNPGVVIGCADCHGGDPTIRATGIARKSKEYNERKKQAHVLPSHPEKWPTSKNPENSYTDLLKESPEFIRFMNPGDLRVAPEACGGCHAGITRAVQKSLMTTSAMLWGGASYNNNILPYKNYLLGESYGKYGEPQSILHGGELTDEMKARGALPQLTSLPQWEVLSPGDVFRIFERGGERIKTQFPEIGNPNPLEEPGLPDVLQSNRGPGTGARIAVPVINIHKTRLNDPHLSFLGTNDHPGDYRSSGCTACHSIYANDRWEKHSGPYAAFGHEGKSQSVDPTIPKDEPGHPLQHVFTRAIPTSQCMVCHMHQPNMFVNSYLGFTMWDYETAAEFMWPKEQKYPTHDERIASYRHNPEAAAARGLWSDKEFLKKVSELNPKLKDTQFADYHGHGWNFRAIFKKDRKGNLLDKENKQVAFDDPEKFKKAVHLSDIHLDLGMHCIDCHFGQDSHGDGNIYGEVAQAVEIQCEDCHGTVKEYASLQTGGPAAKPGTGDLTRMRTPFGESRFIWKGDKLYQRSSVTEGLEWEVRQTKDSVDKNHPHYNEASARAKTVQHFEPGESGYPEWGNLEKISESSDLNALLAHNNEEMSCFACHSSWVTSCAGCHLPIEANWKEKSKHYDGKVTRNFATYNPQVVRDEMFQLGKHGPAKKGKIVPVRSSSALILTSTDINRQKIYIQQPPTAASGHSSQAFAPHFPHTVRTKETKRCNDCHVSKENDNNAIMAQLLLHGTNFVNFMGAYAYVATGEGGVEAVQISEIDEPQAIIGSYLHRFAYPDYYKEHEKKKLVLSEYHKHHGVGGETNTIQHRGEHLYTTAGSGGFRAYDIANVANKGFSERIRTAPVSPLGHDTHVATKNATSFALPTNMPIAPFREQLPENLETPLHDIYHYAVITDSEEGLILVNVDTLQDGEPRNNFFERALTWNEGGVLTGARHVTLGGTNAYILTDSALVILSLDTPLEPKVRAKLPFVSPRASAIQFRYLFVLDKEGFQVVDITDPDRPLHVREASLPLRDARNLYVARTYAYVAGGVEGLQIVDIERPTAPFLYESYTANGEIDDLYDVKVASTNASLFAYLADGKNGFKVVQLTDPERVPGFYGFSPPVKPKLIAVKPTDHPALAISKGLDRDRAVDETGHQVSVFGRLGSRPFTLEEMKRLYLKSDGSLYSFPNSW